MIPNILSGICAAHAALAYNGNYAFILCKSEKVNLR